jgi:NhaP-type Na+/H+ or K+/H+ antiporter
MPQQSNLFSSSTPNGSTVQYRKPAPQRPSRVPLWLRRIELYLYVIIRIYIGIIVLVLPWYPPLWADNQLLNHFPHVATFLMHGAVRGVVSGLGLLNLWIAIVEAVQFRGSTS